VTYTLEINIVEKISSYNLKRADKNSGVLN